MDAKPYYIFMIQLLESTGEKGDYDTPRNRHLYYIDSDKIDDAVRLFTSRILTDLMEYNPKNADQGAVKPVRVEWINHICGHRAAFVFSDGIIEYLYEVEMYDARRSDSGRITPLMWSQYMVEVANKEFANTKYYYTVIDKDFIIPPRKNDVLFAHTTRDALVSLTKKINKETKSTFTITFAAYGEHGTVAWIRSKDDIRVIIITKKCFTPEETAESGDWYKYVE